MFLNKFRVHLKYHFSRALAALLSDDKCVREINTAQNAVNLIFCAVTVWHCMKVISVGRYAFTVWYWNDASCPSLVQSWKEFLSWRLNINTVKRVHCIEYINIATSTCFSGDQLEYMHKQSIISLAYFEFKRGDWCLVRSCL